MNWSISIHCKRAWIDYSLSFLVKIIQQMDDYALLTYRDMPNYKIMHCLMGLITPRSSLGESLATLKDQA